MGWIIHSMSVNRGRDEVRVCVCECEDPGSLKGAKNFKNLRLSAADLAKLTEKIEGEGGKLSQPVGENQPLV